MEKTSKLQERRQFAENEQLSISSPYAAAETVEFFEAGTSPVMTMTVLHGAGPGTDNSEEVIQSVINPAASLPAVVEILM